MIDFAGILTPPSSTTSAFWMCKVGWKMRSHWKNPSATIQHNSPCAVGVSGHVHELLPRLQLELYGARGFSAWLMNASQLSSSFPVNLLYPMSLKGSQKRGEVNVGTHVRRWGAVAAVGAENAITAKKR